MSDVYCVRCGASPCACNEDDDERADPGPHTHVYVDDHDECEACGRHADQFADLPDEMRPDWDGAA